MRPSQLCVLVTAATLVAFIFKFVLEVYLDYEEPWLFPLADINTNDVTQLFQEIPFPVVVWWHPGVRCRKCWNDPEFRQCGPLTCYVTNNEQFHKHPNFKGYLFYGSRINWTNLPLPRNGPSVLWGLLHEESPRNNIPLSHEPVISLFNYTSTFSRHSHVPTTLKDLPSLQSLMDMKYFETAEAKKGYQKNESWVLAPVVYIQTDCLTPLNRDSYVAELAKHIRVDSFGVCLHNRSLPPHLQVPNGLRTMMSDDLIYIVGKYKFALAIENGVCKDYVTEKLWRPLIAGTVPIYIGSPSVADWLPNNRSAILGLNFESPKHLAEYLHYLDSHDEEYDSYRSHKIKSSVTNSRLINLMNTRNYNSEGVKNQSFIQQFECFMCEKAHRQNPEEISIATRQHYSCEMPLSIIDRQPNTTNYWLDWWFHGRCEAQVVRKFVDAGVVNYTIEEFNSAVEALVNDNKCVYNEENARELLTEQLEN